MSGELFLVASGALAMSAVWAAVTVGKKAWRVIQSDRSFAARPVDSSAWPVNPDMKSRPVDPAHMSLVGLRIKHTQLKAARATAIKAKKKRSHYDTQLADITSKILAEEAKTYGTQAAE